MDPIENLEEWEQALSEWMDALGIQIAAIGLEILNRLFEFIDKFDFDGQSVFQNMATLVEIQNALPTLIQGAGFVTVVGDLINKIAEALTKVEEYFTKTFFDFPQKGLEITNTYRAALETVRRSLLGEGLQQIYVSDIVKTLQFHVYSKSRKADFREALRKVLGENGQPMKYFKTYTSDALYQYSRAYTNEVTKALDAQYFYYMGTRIKTTREFCNARFGKVFKKSEVQAWAKQEWQGKIPGTNAQNITIYVGGYNCRHRLLPISEEVYKSFQSRN